MEIRENERLSEYFKGKKILECNTILVFDPDARLIGLRFKVEGDKYYNIYIKDTINKGKPCLGFDPVEQK